MTGKMTQAVLMAVLIMPVAATAEDTATNNVLESYRYDVPENSWFKAKIKPTMKLRAQAVNAKPMTENKPVADSAVAKSPEPSIALPFWKDIPAQ